MGRCKSLKRGVEYSMGIGYHSFKLYGKPGCGKTTMLVGTIAENAEELADLQIINFTRAATLAFLQKFNRLNLPYDLWKNKLRTIHAECYKFIGGKVLNQQDLQLFWEGLGLNYNPYITETNIYRLLNTYPANALMQCINLVRNNPDKMHIAVEVANYINLKNWDFSKILQAYSLFKRQLDKIDFVDMLELGYFNGFKFTGNPVIIDEAQDLSPLMWQLVYRSLPRTTWIAGDPYQNIYSFQGSDLIYFKSFQGIGLDIKESKRFGFGIKVATKSMLPHLDWDVKNEKDILREIKTLKGLMRIIEEKTNTYLLFRTNFEMLHFAFILKKFGVPFDVEYLGIDYVDRIKTAWELLNKNLSIDEEDIRIMLFLSKYTYLVELIPHKPVLTLEELKKTHPDFSFLEKPIEDWIYDPLLLYLNDNRTPGHYLKLCTMHQSKGLECNTVVIMHYPQQEVKRRLQHEYKDMIKEEQRLFYVGVSRARVRCYIAKMEDILSEFGLEGVIGHDWYNQWKEIFGSIIG